MYGSGNNPNRVSDIVQLMAVQELHHLWRGVLKKLAVNGKLAELKNRISQSRRLAMVLVVIGAVVVTYVIIRVVI